MQFSRISPAPKSSTARASSTASMSRPSRPPRMVHCHQQYSSPFGPGLLVLMVGRGVAAGSCTYTLRGSIDTTTACAPYACPKILALSMDTTSLLVHNSPLAHWLFVVRVLYQAVLNTTPRLTRLQQQQHPPSRVRELGRVDLNWQAMCVYKHIPRQLPTLTEKYVSLSRLTMHMLRFRSSHSHQIGSNNTLCRTPDSALVQPLRAQPTLFLQQGVYVLKATLKMPGACYVIRMWFNKHRGSLA